jgi:hypothetical protein
VFRKLRRLRARLRHSRKNVYFYQLTQILKILNFAIVIYICCEIQDYHKMAKILFTKEMRKATRDVHDISDALVNAKLAFGK